MVSPLRAMASGMAFLSLIGGFPALISEDGYSVQHCFWGWARVITVVSSPLVLLGSCEVAFQALNSTMFDIGLRLRDNLSMTDSLCYPGLFATNFTLTFISLAFLFWNLTGIDGLFKKYKELESLKLDPKDIKKLARNLNYYIYALLLMNGCLNIISGIAGVTAIYPNVPYTNGWVILTFIIWVYCCFVGYFSPIQASAYLNSSFNLTLVRLYQDNYAKYMSEKYPCQRRLVKLAKDKAKRLSQIEQEEMHPQLKTPIKTPPPSKPTQVSPIPEFHTLYNISSALEDDLKTGLDLQYVIEQVNEFFATFLLLEFGVGLITASISAYLTFLIPEAFATQDEEGSSRAAFIVKLTAGGSHALLCLLTLLRQIGLTYRGHRIASGNQIIRNTLRESFLENRHYSLSDQEKVLLDLLAEKTSEACPIRPHSLFDLNLSTLLSALGLCLTYVIVLLQFRMSEG